MKDWTVFCNAHILDSFNLLKLNNIIMKTTRNLFMALILGSLFTVASCTERTTTTEEKTETKKMEITEEKAKDATSKLDDQTKKVEESLEKLDEEFATNN